MEKQFNNKYYRWLLVCAFSIDSILRYVEQIFVKLPIVSEISFLFIPALFVILFFLSRNKFFRISYFDIFFILGFYIILFLSYLFNSESQKYIEENLLQLIFCIVPYYFLGKVCIVDDDTKKLLIIFSEIAVVIAWGYLIYFYSTGRTLGTDAMYESYALIFHTLVLLWASFTKPNILRIALSIAGIFYALSMGTRGPIIILAAYILYLLFKKTKKSFTWKIIVFLLILTAVIIISNKLMLYNIVLSLKKIIGNWGLSTRIFDDYLFDIAKDSLDERRIIYDKLINLLIENPLGYGIYGEYPFVGWSAHNIYLQVCFEFGLLFGPVLILLFFILCVKSIKCVWNCNTRDFIMLWICYILSQGFFGGNILSNYMFFTIGIMLGQIQFNRYKKGRKV